jgi:hypothetical protein
MAEEQTPFEHACALLEDMMRLPQQTDTAQRLMERWPAFFSAANAMIAPEDTQRIVDALAQWLRHLRGETIALQADLLLLQAQDPEPGA